tara:strand:- start:86 stop:1066 length:981 start_codon:yes stop_codon:yes gene_type:complete
MSNFQSQVNILCDKYKELSQTIMNHVNEYELHHEKHMKHYESNLDKFLKLNNNDLFNFFIKNYLHIMPIIVDHNMDYFLTQKPYVLKKSKRGNKKRPNTKATYIIEGNMLRYVFYTLKKSPNNNKISDNTDIKNIFGEFVQMFDLFYNDNENYLIELKEYVTKNFSNSKSFKKMLSVISNYEIIIADEEEVEEEVSTDDENNEDKKNSNDGDGGGGGGGGMFDFANSLMGNSSIGELAKEISEGISKEDLKAFEDVKDPGELFKKMMSPGENGSSGFGNIISKIAGTIGKKMSDGSIDQEKMSKEAQNMMKKMGGGMGASMFKNLF